VGEPRKASTIQRPAATWRLKAPSAISGALNQGTGSPRMIPPLRPSTVPMRKPSLCSLTIVILGKFCPNPMGPGWPFRQWRRLHNF